MEGVGSGIDGWNQLCDDNETRSDRGWVAQRPLNKKLWRLIRQDFFIDQMSFLSLNQQYQSTKVVM